MAAANLGLPSPPRLVEYVASLESLQKVVDCSRKHRDEKVVVIVAGCRPLRDAQNLLDGLSLKMRHKEWHIIGLDELQALAARATELLDQLERSSYLALHTGNDFLIGDGKMPHPDGAACDCDAASVKKRVAKMLSLPQGMDPPTGFNRTMVAVMEENRQRLRRDVLISSDSLLKLGLQIETHIIRRLEKELDQHVTTNVMLPEELWPDLQRQRMRYPPEDSTSFASLAREAAEAEAADQWAPDRDTSPDSINE